MKRKKNLYAVLLLCSYFVAMLVKLLLRVVTLGMIYLNDTAIILITLSIIVFAAIKYKEI